MKELMGGLWLTGLIAWAILGVVPGLVCIGIGVAAGSCELAKLRRAEQAEASWRKTYPPYGY